MTDDPPGDHTVAWNSGHDLLVLFTDGITDALNPAGEAMGEQRVLDAITCDPEVSPEETVRRVFAALDTFTGGVRPRDDLTLVVLRT
jgi:sigma-B regulation protein RsbU (phosphoserine phosphatase)